MKYYIEFVSGNIKTIKADKINVTPNGDVAFISEEWGLKENAKGENIRALIKADATHVFAKGQWVSINKVENE